MQSPVSRSLILVHSPLAGDDDSIMEIGRRLHAEIDRVERLDFHRYPQVRPGGVGRDASISEEEDTGDRLQVR